MEPLAILRAVRRGWLIVVVFGLAGLVLAGWYSSTRTPMYRSTSSLFFSVTGGDSTTNLLQGSTYSQNAVSSYALLATMPVVLKPVIADLGLDTTPTSFARRISTTIPPDSVVMNIAVVSDDPDAAAEQANAVAGELQRLVGTLSSKGRGEDGGGVTVEATTVGEAATPPYPFAPNTKRTMLLGLLVGLFVGLMVALLRDVLDTRIRTDDDVHAITDIPVLGQVPEDSAAAEGGILAPGDHRRHAESLRRLIGNLDYVNYSGTVRSLMVTSSLPNEGKTHISVNLAVILSESQRVVLVDADLRNPTVAKRLGLDDLVGLSTVLSGRASLQDVIQPWRRGQMDVLSAGRIPPNPSALIGSQRMAEVIAELVSKYDVVVIDSPPVIPVSDSTLLGKAVDGTLLVTNTRRTNRRQLTDCLADLARSGTRVLGIVLNRTQSQNDAYGYYQDQQVSRAEEAHQTERNPKKEPAPSALVKPPRGN